MDEFLYLIITTAVDVLSPPGNDFNEFKLLLNHFTI